MPRSRRVPPTPPRSRTFLIVCLAILVSVAALLLPQTGAAAKPKPKNPSNGQIRNAQAVKAQAAKDVGQLSAKIAVINDKIVTLDGRAEAAREALNYALWQLKQATDAATAARKAVDAAQSRVDVAQVQFGRYIRQSFMSAGNDASGLLAGGDPNAVLQRSDLARYRASRQNDTIAQLNLATTQRSNADAKARSAKAKQQKATTAAQAATTKAVAAARTARDEKASLVSQRGTMQAQLQSAGMRLTGLLDQRKAYQVWKAAEDKRIRLAREAAARAAAADQARRQANAPQQAARGANGTGGPAPSWGSFSWTPAKGQAAVNRAMQMLGVPYSFAAGNKDGTTYGVCTPGDGGWNDCNVRGIDCSGLVMYAWSYLLGIDNMVHYTVWQYPNLGSFHPSPDQLMPGDLVFLSSDGSTGPNLHHVMIYVGNGNVIEAPYSGSYVHIVPLYSEVGWFATRPGT